MKLRHLSLPYPTPYSKAAHFQDCVVRAFLDSKSSPSAIRGVARATPPPTIITFTPPPTYTCGRREVSRLTGQQLAHLTASTPFGRAEFHEALRGGQTTYHGPGQLVAYPILDLKTHGLTARCYVNMLEEVVMKTCARFEVTSIRTDNPGVWTKRSNGDEKICAVGVHLRRNVASHGIGLNVGLEPLRWLDRIVACGLEGKGATSLQREGVEGVGAQDVATVFVEEFGRILVGVDATEKIEEKELLSSLKADSNQSV